MPIRRVDNFIDAYRERAGAADVHQMSGRGVHTAITAHVNQEIASRLGFGAGDTVVDVGCGDGSLLVQLAGTIERGIGVVPTPEEAERLRREHGSRRTLEFRVGL